MKKIKIGIDPDVKKSGVAYLFKGNAINQQIIKTEQLSFFELFDVLKSYKELGETLDVFIESGWENKSNWHVKSEDTKQVVAYKGNSVGRNHEVGRKIVEMCEYLSIPYTLVRPTKTKTTPEQFYKLTSIKLKKSQQDMIDAGMMLVGR